MLVAKSINTIRNEGWGSFFRKAGGFMNVWIEPLKRAFAPWAKYKISRLPPEKNDTNELVDFIFNNFCGLIRPAQVKSEIAQLAALVKELRPKAVLEIGTFKGGTLFLWSRLADPRAAVISVDLPGGAFGGGYPEWKTELYKKFALPGQPLRLLRLDSHASSTRAEVEKLLGDAPLDFLFIDGDHTYAGVKKDFELYAPLVRKGGLVALHDVAFHPPETGCEVHRFWNEIKSAHANHEEFIENPDQHWAGIGVLRI